MSSRYKSNAMVGQLLKFLTFNTVFSKIGKLLGKMVLYNNLMVVEIYCSLKHEDFYLKLSFQYLLNNKEQ